MGNPLGPTLANVFLCFNESKWLDDCPFEFKPKLYRRYVDDIFLLFSDNSHVNLFLNYLNNKHPNMQFTSASEINNNISFLDVNIHRKNNKFETNVYRKQTFTGLGSRYDSFVPRSFKDNVITCLVHRAYRICSSFTDFDFELSNLRKYFSGNKYPQHLFDRYVSKFLNNVFNPQPKVLTVPRKNIFMKLPYFGIKSNELKKELCQLLSKFYPQIKLNLILYNNCTIQSFFPFKDKISPLIASNVIYKYSCGQCDSTYIGETKMQLKVRISQHKGISYRTDVPYSNPSFSSIRDHSLNSDHPILLQNFKIIDRCKKFDIRILESVNIHKFRPNLNEQTSSFPLSILR